MKRINKIMLLSVVLITYMTAMQSQNLDLVSKSKRDSMLVAKAKEVVLRYGPEYYREYKTPVIERSTVPSKWKHEGRVLYHVIFFYDTTKESLEEQYAAKVNFWGDKGGEPVSILFGNGIGLTIESLERDPEKQKTIPQIPYQQGGGLILILYDSIDGESVDKAKPTNIDELKRRGYEYKDGEWVNPKQFISPNIDLLKRKGYEKRDDGQWIKTKKDVPLQIK